MIRARQLGANLSRRTALRYLACGVAPLLASAEKGRSSVAAQDATPSAAGAEIAPGVTVELLSAGLPAAAPGQRLLLARVILQPGSTVPAHIHPGANALAVVAGSFGFTPLMGQISVTRAATAGTPITEQPAPGVDVLLNPGDALLYDADVAHTARGASADEPTVVMIAALFATDQPLLIPTDIHGTPAAGSATS